MKVTSKPHTVQVSIHGLMVVTLVFLFLLGCEGDNDAVTNIGHPESGALSFELVWHQSLARPTDYQPQAVVCGSEDNQVWTVQAVINTVSSTVATGGPWECSDDSGKIQSVPIGSNYNIVVYGYNNQGYPTYSGTKSDITVTAGSNNAGTIDADQFYTSATSPENTATGIDPDQVIFEWDQAAGAAGYQLWISKTDPISDLDRMVFNTTALFQTVVLESGTTYYWTVFPMDFDAQRSWYETVYSFTTASGGGTPTDDYYEDNDTRGMAYDLSSYSWVNLSMIDGYGNAVFGDDDYYRIDVDSYHENITVDCTFLHDLGDIDIELQDSDGNILMEGSSITDDEFIGIVHLGGSGPATYYIKVFLIDDGQNDSNLYDLLWTAS